MKETGTVSRAPLFRRVMNKLLPITQSDVVFQPATEPGEWIRIVNAAQTVMQGVIDSVTIPTTIIDNDANFTPDLVGKVIYRVMSTSGTDAGDCLRLPEAQARIERVIDAHTLVVDAIIFRVGVTSLYYAIDNHTGKITSSIKGTLSSTSAGKLIDSTANFNGSLVGKYAIVINFDADGENRRAKITAVDSTTQLSLDYDIATSTGLMYMIVVDSDDLRYVLSAHYEFLTNSESRVLSVILKDGTYREGNIGTMSSKIIKPFQYSLWYVGDWNKTGVIISGARADTPTTKTRTRFSMVTRTHVKASGIYFQYFNSAPFYTLHHGVSFIDRCRVSNCNYVISAAAMSYAQGKDLTIDNISNAVCLFSFHSGLQINGVWDITGTIPICDNNDAAFIEFGISSITGGGAFSIGSLNNNTLKHFGAAPIADLVATNRAAGIYNYYFYTNSVSPTANAGAGVLPATPEGFIEIYVAGVLRKIPYYPT